MVSTLDSDRHSDLLVIWVRFPGERRFFTPFSPGLQKRVLLQLVALRPS
jgi:hypothetical protein